MKGKKIYEFKNKVRLIYLNQLGFNLFFTKEVRGWIFSKSEDYGPARKHEHCRSANWREPFKILITKEEFLQMSLNNEG